MTNNLPDEKPLRTTSFVVHATRGVVRDRNTRRKSMLIVLLVAVALLICGSTFLQPALDWHTHPGWFILFWIVCAWLAFTAILLALFDLLMMRIEARKAERELRESIAKTPDSPGANDE